MSRKAKHNTRIRARILAAAGPVFRQEGYEGASVDALMKQAGLTRGAFYAHFNSKAHLFEAVVAEQDFVASLLANRSEASPDALWLGMRSIFRLILLPQHLKLITQCWSMPMLMRDVAMKGEEAKHALEVSHRAVLEEMNRGIRARHHGTLSAALTTACGAILMASACTTPEDQERILKAASDAVGSAILSLEKSAAT